MNGWSEVLGDAKTDASETAGNQIRAALPQQTRPRRRCGNRAANVAFDPPLTVPVCNRRGGVVRDQLGGQLARGGRQRNRPVDSHVSGPTSHVGMFLCHHTCQRSDGGTLRSEERRGGTAGGT